MYACKLYIYISILFVYLKQIMHTYIGILMFNHSDINEIG